MTQTHTAPSVEGAPAPGRFYAGVFAVAAAGLMLQIVQTRILSVITWYHMAFFTISMAMFGLTAGAIWVYRRHRVLAAGEPLGYLLAHSSAAFAVTLAVSLILQLTIVTTASMSATAVAAWGMLALCLAAPCFFCGVTLSLALTRSPYPLPRVYAVDLFGAAVGCLGVLLLLGVTDGPSAILWIGVLAAVGALCFADPAARRAATARGASGILVRRLPILLAVLAGMALVNGLVRFGIQPIFVKEALDERGASLEYEKWNSFSRISVFSERTARPYLWGPSPRYPTNIVAPERLMTIDGLARTYLHRFGGNPRDADFLRYDVTNIAYVLPGERAAVIGVGGGRDMLSAWVFGHRDVTGVEVNPILASMLTTNRRFADYASLYRIPGMHFVVDEARSWFARTNQSFDFIQMSLIDTWAATGAGAYTLTENGLYTVECWKTLLSRLTPRGVFTASRWYAPGEVNETGRMLSLAVATLREMGVAEPRRHIFLAACGHVAALVVSRQPFPEESVRALETQSNEMQFETLVTPRALPGSPVLQRILQARDRKELQAYTSTLELDLTPPTDDRPFFFNQLPLNHPIRALRLAQNNRFEGVFAGNLVATGTLITILLISLVLVVLTILLPSRSAVREAGRRLSIAGTVYFALIGLGFMMVEIGLLQRCSVFLGHPVYSLSVVLFGLILATGVGSLLSDRFPLSRPALVLFWAMAAGLYLLSLPIWMPGLLLGHDGDGLVSRAGLCLLILAPAGVLMGFGFPTGMRLVGARDARLTPWLWGVNGAAGVLAGSCAIALSLAFGIRAALGLGAICYLALPLAVRGMGSENPGEAEPAPKRRPRS